MQYITKRVASVYEGCMEKLLAAYKKGGFNITEIHCDNKCCKVMDPFLAKKYPRIKIKYAEAQ